MNAIVYARVSTNPQFIHGISIAEQLSAANAFAVKKNFKVVETVIHNHNGHSNDVGQLLNGRHKNIVINDVSRLSRSKERAINIVKKACKKNKKLFFIKENIIIQKPEGQEYDKFLESLDKAVIESKTLGVRISAVKQYKKLKGEYIGGKIPYGLDIYQEETLNESGQLRIVKKYCLNDSQYNVIKFIMLCASKNYTAGELSNAMKLISVYKENIELVDETHDGNIITYDIRKKNTEPMKPKDIAALLNEYEVMYVDNKQFTPSIVRAIISNYSKLCSYIRHIDINQQNINIDQNRDVEMEDEQDLINRMRKFRFTDAEEFAKFERFRSSQSFN